MALCGAHERTSELEEDDIWANPQVLASLFFLFTRNKNGWCNLTPQWRGRGLLSGSSLECEGEVTQKGKEKRRGEASKAQGSSPVWK